MGKKFLVGAIVTCVAIGFVIFMDNSYNKSILFAAGNSDARYVMNKTKDGFLRLDTVTGHVSLCHEKASSWVCEAVADDRQALEKEIARLDDRIGVLKRHIKKSKTRMFNLPSDAEIDEVMSYFEKFVKRFKKFSSFFEDEKKPEDSI